MIRRMKRRAFLSVCTQRSSLMYGIKIEQWSQLLSLLFCLCKNCLFWYNAPSVNSDGAFFCWVKSYRFWLKSGKGANRCRATYIVGYTAIAHPVRTQIRIQAHHQLQAFSSCCTKSFEPKLSSFQAKYRLGLRYYIYSHRARVAVSGNCKRSLHQESSGVCMFQPHRYDADPGGTSHGSQAGAPGTGVDVSFGSGRAVCGSGVPGKARKTGLCAEYVPEGRTTRQCGGGKFLQLPQVWIGISDQLCDPSAGAKFNFSVHWRIL